MTANPIASNSVGAEDLARELETNRFNPCVGQRLLSVNDRVRIWSIRLQPGGRLPFHRHVLDYFWTATSEGKAISHSEDGSVVERAYREGDTQYLRYGTGEHKVHDLVNVGNTVLGFTTVEFLASANPPLPLPPTLVIGD